MKFRLEPQAEGFGFAFGLFRQMEALASDHVIDAKFQLGLRGLYFQKVIVKGFHGQWPGVLVFPPF